MPFVGDALNNEKVTIINENACNFIKQTKKKFDIIFIDTTDFNSTEDLDSSKTNLRDLPSTFTTSSFSTPQELYNQWPSGSLGESPY